MRVPPGEPSARNGRPSRNMISGPIELTGRRPGRGAFGDSGSDAKSSMWSLSRKPVPSGTMPVPKKSLIDWVSETTFPASSTTQRWVVLAASPVLGAKFPKG